MSLFVWKKYAALAAMACCAAPVLAAGSAGVDPAQVIAESSQMKITAQDLETDLQRIPAQYRAEVLANRQRLSKILENLVINKTLAAQARSAGIDKEADMTRQIQNAAEKMLAQEQLNRVVNAVPLPDFTQTAREQYQLNTDKYTEQPTVHASHILIGTKSRSAEEALELARKVREQAVAGSKKFDELALEYSDDPSAKSNKGDLGFFEAKRMVKPFADTAFAMNTPGEISEPVKTQFGYHLIQFHESKPRTVRTFEEVKDKIIQGEREKFQNEQRKKLLSDILSDPSLKLNEEAADRFLSRMPIAADPKASSAGKP